LEKGGDMKTTCKVITIKSTEETLRGAQRVMEGLMRREKVSTRPSEYSFSSFEAFRKALTLQRFQLLKVIRENNPKSIHELAKLTGRDMKNVSEDLRALKEMELVELEPHGRLKTPRVKYDEIRFEVAM
jgi:predicted transcriptional regulator